LTKCFIADGGGAGSGWSDARCEDVFKDASGRCSVGAVQDGACRGSRADEVEQFVKRSNCHRGTVGLGKVLFIALFESVFDGCWVCDGFPVVPSFHVAVKMELIVVVDGDIESGDAGVGSGVKSKFHFPKSCVAALHFSNLVNMVGRTETVI